MRPFVERDRERRCQGGAQGAASRRQARHSQKDVVLDNLDDVIADVSGEEATASTNARCSMPCGPSSWTEFGEELKIGNFNAIITDYENENGEIAGMYREPRGSITHPHRDETITLGTLMVEDYERPVWNFNKLLYIEKEGANEALKEVRWLERHDCAVMSSKGFSTRAARDLIDKLAEHDEPVEVFCVHDADASGGMIYQTLQEATKARGARKIKIINLGLEPWEAIAMGLEVETVKAGERRKPIADYVKDASEQTAPDGDDWDRWLQTHRVELNAMTTPQFIAWLDGKMDEHGVGKLVPPAEVLTAELNQRVEQKVRATLTERILREAGLDRQVDATVAWRLATRKAGIVGLTFHDLRGTAVTRLAEAECTNAEIASITGHSMRDVARILDRYLARTDKIALAAIAKLNGVRRERKR